MAKRKNPPDATQHDLQPLREHLARLDARVKTLEEQAERDRAVVKMQGDHARIHHVEPEPPADPGPLTSPFDS